MAEPAILAEPAAPATTAPARPAPASRAEARYAAEPISRFAVPDEADLPDNARQAFASVREKAGFTPNWLRALAVNPDAAYRMVAFYEHLFDPARSRLRAHERELIAVVVSAANRCSYCTLNHSQSLGAQWHDHARALRVALNHREVPLSPREHALAELVLRVTRDPVAVEKADLEALKPHGLDEAAIVEAIEIAGFFSYANRLTIALGVKPDAEFFQR